MIVYLRWILICSKSEAILLQWIIKMDSCHQSPWIIKNAHISMNIGYFFDLFGSLYSVKHADFKCIIIFPKNSLFDEIWAFYRTHFWKKIKFFFLIVYYKSKTSSKFSMSKLLLIARLLVHVNWWSFTCDES